MRTTKMLRLPGLPERTPSHSTHTGKYLRMLVNYGFADEPLHVKLPDSRHLQSPSIPYSISAKDLNGMWI